MAVLLTWALFVGWTTVGLAVLRLGRFRRTVASLLLAPAVGFAAVVVPVYVFVRFGLAVRLTAVPVGGALLAGALVVLWRGRTGAGPARRAWTRSRVFAALLAGTFVLNAWPLFEYGFDWVANGNDDMANYCLMATGYRDHGYAGVPGAAAVRGGSDQTLPYWFEFFVREIRPGSEVLLAVVSTWTGLSAVQVFMPVIVALDVALVAAAAGLASAATKRRAVGAATAALLVVSSQTAYGVVQQLIAQVSGLALLCAALAVAIGRFRRLPRAVLWRRAGASGVVFAGQVVFYPEVIPLLVGGCVLIGLRDIARRRLERRYLTHAAAGAAVMLAALPVYVCGAVEFLAHQTGWGVLSEAWVREMFPFHLTPRLGALVWGLLPLTGPESLPVQNAAVSAGLVLMGALVLVAGAGLRRGWGFSAVLVVGLVMGGALVAKSGAFGLFKLSMFVQPFLWSTAAAWALTRRAGGARAAACAVLAAVAVQNARVQFWYVDQSRGDECRVQLPAVSAGHGLSAFRADYARRAADGRVERVLVASENVVLMKLVAAEVRGVPTGMLGVNPFEPPVRNILPVVEDTPVGRRHRDWGPALDALRAAYPPEPADGGPAVRDPATGGTLHRLIATPPDRAGAAPDRVLVVAPGGSLSVLNRYHHPEGGPLLVSAPLSEVRNFAVFCDATGARQHFLGMREATGVALQLIERDPSFPERTAVGVGRTVVVDLLNPSPRVRVLVDVTGSFRAAPDARTVPPLEVVGDRRVPFGAGGLGSARLVSPPVAPQAAGDGRYLAIEFGEPLRNPNRLGAAERMWGADVPRDRRLLAGHLRDLSVLSEEEYAAFRPPVAVSNFPADLAHPHLEYSGLFEEGWVGTEFKVRLTQPAPGQEAVVRGLVPEVPANGAGFRTEMTVLIDGTPVAARVLKTGPFEVRAPGGAGTGPRWIEVRFSEAQRLPAPDGRRVVAHLASVGFEPARAGPTRPPEHLAAFPADLDHPKVNPTGIDTDGWCAATAAATLWQAGPGRDVVVRGQIPEIDGRYQFRTELTVSADGVELAKRGLGTGAFEVRVPADGAAGARRIECRFSVPQALPQPDGRSVGALLRFVGFEGTKPAP
jgi:hypothetical protein